MKKLGTVFVVLITILSMAMIPAAQACSRLVYQGSLNGPITARSMDWLNEPQAKLWVFPKGMERDGGTGDSSIKWTSKYGSIITSSYDIATVDGINDQGLVVNLLFLTETDFGNGEVQEGEKTLSIGGWGQYVLDHYATVGEALRGLEKEPFRIITTTLYGLNEIRPGAIPAAALEYEIHGVKLGDTKFGLHMSISDPCGDSAIIEYINGKQVIHHSPEYNVLTNDPTFDEQLALNTSWDTLNNFWTNDGKLSNETGPLLFLPGGRSATDRFIRAKNYLDEMNYKSLTADRRSEIAAAFGIIRNVSDPLGLASGAFTTTQWRAVATQNKDDNFTYFFEYTKNPSLVWLNMENQDLEEGADVKVLTNDDITSGELAGEVSEKLKEEDAYSWDLTAVMD